MKISSQSQNQLRYKIGRIATAIAFALVIGGFATGSARADDRWGYDDRGGDRHYDNDDRGRRGPDVYYEPQPDYYYRPPPDYYYAPEPYYDGRQSRPDGINLFFGF